MKFRPNLDNCFKYLEHWQLKYILHTIGFEQDFNTVLPDDSFFKMIAIRLARKADELAGER